MDSFQQVFIVGPSHSLTALGPFTGISAGGWVGEEEQEVEDLLCPVFCYYHISCHMPRPHIQFFKSQDRSFEDCWALSFFVKSSFLACSFLSRILLKVGFYLLLIKDKYNKSWLQFQHLRN